MENNHYFPQPPPEELWTDQEQQQEEVFGQDQFAPHRIAGETRTNAGTVLPEGTLTPPQLQTFPVHPHHTRNPAVEAGLQFGTETVRGFFEGILALAG